ncbi:MAG: amino acid/amide transporter rane protein 2, family / amino acid/amide transporter [Frankiales bacterium]|nr:amino acid/amide transporter rane protein 2, family / amino acid/amide transporter [Frankiales bacterium]
MTFFLTFLVTGLVVGCIYALTATGLVVTYMTSGIFNFAHGAIGMIAAFIYWQFAIGWGWPVPVALFATLFVAAPLMGAVIERLLIRPIRGASVDLAIVITLALLLLLIGVANVIWKGTAVRIVPPFFAGHSVRISTLSVTYHQIVVVVVAIAVAVALKLLFSQTRIGIAMRGVVDDPDLAAMAGASPARVQQLSWALGASLAGLAGILLAPLVNLDILTLTLLVINGYAAALVGRLRSLPLTAAGAIALGLMVNAAKIYGPDAGRIWHPLAGFIRDNQSVIPMAFLFVMLVTLPSARLRSGSLIGPPAPRAAGLRSSVAWGAALVVVVAVAAPHLSSSNVVTSSKALIFALTLLSLVLLTGYGGQVSLCQLTFVGLGSYAMGTWGGGSLLSVLAAVALSAAAGAAVALPTLRLRGLYLALATFAFASAADLVFFNRVFGAGGSLDVPRLHLPGVSFKSGEAYLVLLAVVFVACSVLVLAIRRGRYGRQLAALNDSPAACATLGVNINITKLAVFAVSAGMAGFAGALFGGLRGQVGPNDFVALASLTMLLLLRVGGINTVTGALFGGVVLASFPTLQEHVPSNWPLSYLLTGIAAVSIGRDPNGIGGRIADAAERLRARRSGPPVNPAAATALDYEEVRLVGV